MGWFSRYLDTVGDGSGTTNANGNYAAEADHFKINGPAGKVMRLHRMLVTIEDTSGMQAEEYGNLGAALTNGITAYYESNVEDKVYLMDGGSVKTNADWARYCHDVDVKSWGAGNELLTVRWTFDKAGVPIVLQGANGSVLTVVLNDDLTGLISHTFIVQGYD